MWQQGHYMGPDSGIHSGAGTQAPSLTGRCDLYSSVSIILESYFYAYTIKELYSVYSVGTY